MKDFIISRKKLGQSILAVLFWIMIWQLACMLVQQEMLIASPASVIKQMIQLSSTEVFWKSIAFSTSRMLMGFFLAFSGGIFLAVLSYRISWIAYLFSPLMTVIKTAPVASYIILCLLFSSARMLPVVISFLMALPVFYTNILRGLHAVDKQLLEMAKVYDMSVKNQIYGIYFSEMLPFLFSAASVALGFCWKSAIAAEVIGLPLGSIGEHLYQAKIFLDTKNLFAWTIIIILLSLCIEKCFLLVLKRLVSYIESR